MGRALHMMLDGMTLTPPSVCCVRGYLESVAKQTSLHIIAGPFFFILESYQEAWVIVAESHIAVKWWPDGLVLVDLFSCKPFNAETLETFTVETFQLEHCQVRALERLGLG